MSRLTPDFTLFYVYVLMTRKTNALLFLLFISQLLAVGSIFAQETNRSWSLKCYTQFFLNDQQQSLNEGNVYPFGRFSPAVSLRLDKQRPVWIDFQLRRFALQRNEVTAVRKIGTDIAVNIDATWEQFSTGRLSIGAGGSLGFFFSEKEELGISQDLTIINERISRRTGVDLGLLLRGRLQLNNSWSVDCKLGILGLAPTKESESRQFPTFNSPVNTTDNFTVDVIFLPQVNLGIAYKLW